MNSSNDNIKLSIVVVTYFNDDELLETLRSLPDDIFNSELNTEIVVVDGGENLKGWIPQSFFHSSRNIRIISEQDKGIYDAYNKGLRASKGKYIYYLNSGDLYLDRDQYIQKAINLLDNNDAHSYVHANLYYSDTEIGEVNLKPFPENVGRGMPFLLPTTLFRKTVLIKVGGFDESYIVAGDYDLACKLMKNGKSGDYLYLSPVKMDGSGVSSRLEFKGICECYRSLLSNRLLTPSVTYGAVKRTFRFVTRKALDLTGLNFVKKSIKRKIHS